MEPAQAKKTRSLRTNDQTSLETPTTETAFNRSPLAPAITTPFALCAIEKYLNAPPITKAYSRSIFSTTAANRKGSIMPHARLAHRSSNRRGATVAPDIETAIGINTLRFQCPNTGREV